MVTWRRWRAAGRGLIEFSDGVLEEFRVAQPGRKVRIVTVHPPPGAVDWGSSTMAGILFV
ncbi:hypothetical protein ONR57_22600 [Hoyosella sp. YIM 151337]|uniref:hypothetical protein n=1 Tax=Hoyosella sp. YIM 151337 TaxID=2992742 RepID=UPI0022365A0E|nr:hypothetical protein [Hoyosella sp. YIM 151337]MCW4356099.1 hypothetical protein [Hoyosella sp. YIM 151337]